MSNPTVLYFGASRGVAFESYSSLAAKRPDLHHVLLLRSPSRFKETEEFKGLPNEVIERSTYFEGDAHNADSIRNVLQTCGPNLFAIVTSIGARPPEGTIATVKALVTGFVPNPADICTRALAILVTELNKVYPTLSTKPKFILCSSMGMGKKAHQVLAFGLGGFYSTMLQAAHDDKIAMELVMDKITLPSSKPLPHFVPDPSERLPHILSDAAYDALPSAFIPREDVVVMRPALMTDGSSKGWNTDENKGGYRVIQEGPGADETKGKKLYTISRKDCGNFVSTMLATADKDAVSQGVAADWWGKQPVIGY